MPLLLQALNPIFGKEVSALEIKKSKKLLAKTCDIINSIWLKRTPFIAGSEISIADLLASTELEQLGNLMKLINNQSTIITSHYASMLYHLFTFGRSFKKKNSHNSFHKYINDYLYGF